MRRLISQIILSICLIILNLSFQIYYAVHPFNNKNVLSTINYLCSDYFKGRLTGTIENREIEEYIKLKFIENNLKPFMGDYTQSFKINYPHRITGEPRLNIIDNEGNTIKQFDYGKDYKEDMLNFKNNTIKFDKQNPSIISKDTLIQVEENLDYFLFYVPSKDNLNFRSSFVNTARWSMCVMVTNNTLNLINKYLSEGYSVDCFIPFTIKEAMARNIMGYIEGSNSSLAPIIISAHFDHLGTDLNNTIYRGALDNASGTSFMLEMVKYISSLGKPERSILFLGFNAEEFGCVGSSEFVKKYKENIMNSKVYNFDMIGSDKGVPLCIVGGKKDTAKTDFLRSVSNTCSDEKIHFNYLFEDASDHKAFRENNIDAITFCDNDNSKIHTPNDIPENISLTAIDRCFNVASKEIVKYAFNNNLMILYYREALLSSLIILVVTIFISSRKKYKY
ncbi:M28 family metallopeptidase [Clostridium sp. JNZ J1-5]